MAPVVAPRRASELVSGPLPSRPAPRCLIQRGEMPAQALLFLPQPHARPLAVLNELDASGPKGANNLTHSVIPTAQSVAPPMTRSREQSKAAAVCLRQDWLLPPMTGKDSITRDIEACGSLLRKLAVSWEART